MKTTSQSQHVTVDTGEFCDILNPAVPHLCKPTERKLVRKYENNANFITISHRKRHDSQNQQ